MARPLPLHPASPVPPPEGADREVPVGCRPCAVDDSDRPGFGTASVQRAVRPREAPDHIENQVLRLLTDPAVEVIELRPLVLFRWLALSPHNEITIRRPFPYPLLRALR